MRLNKLSQRLLFLFLFLSVVFPTVFTVFNSALLFGIAILNSGKIKFNNRWFFLTLGLMFIGLLYCLYGLILQGNVDAFLYTGVIYIILPIIVYISAVLYTGFSNSKIHSLFRILTLCTSAYLLLIAFNVFDLNNLESLKAFLNINLARSEITNIHSVSITSLLFLIPYFFVSTVSHNKNESGGWLDIFIIILSMLACFFSGRRAFFLILLVCILYLIFSAKVKVWKKVLFLMLLVVTIYYSWDLLTIIIYKGGNNFKDIRVNESNRILNEFYRSPILGWGNGHIIKNYDRSSEMPWRFELSYQSLLMQTGIIGFLIYSYFVLKLFYSLYIRRLTPYLVALICMFIVYATNPYFNTIDVMWLFAIPISRILVYDGHFVTKKRYFTASSGYFIDSSHLAIFK